LLLWNVRTNPLITKKLALLLAALTACARGTGKAFRASDRGRENRNFVWSTSRLRAVHASSH